MYVVWIAHYCDLGTAEVGEKVVELGKRFS